MSAISRNQPERPISCRRRTVTERLGTISASETSRAAIASSSAIMFSLRPTIVTSWHAIDTMNVSNAKYQYSARRARPSNRAY